MNLPMSTVSYSMVRKVESPFRRRIYASNRALFGELLGKSLRDVVFFFFSFFLLKKKSLTASKSWIYGDLIN